MRVTLASLACGTGCARNEPGRPGPRQAAAPRLIGSGDPAAVVWSYEVAVDPTLDLDVRATFTAPVGGSLRVDESADGFVDRIELQDGAAWRKVAADDPGWKDACASRCTVRYHVRLRDAARTLRDQDTAIASGGALFAPPSTWLLRPSDVPRGRYRFHVTPVAGVRFATGVRRAPPPAGPDTYEAATSALEESAFAGFGALRIGQVAEPGIAYALAPGVALPDAVVARWFRAEVDALTPYLGQPPGGYAMLLVAPGASAATGGKTLGGGGGSIFLQLGTRVSEQNALDDWVVAHELVHVALPDLDRRYSWFAEGLATYVEPIARARAGLVAPAKVWAEMVEGMPQGLPGPRSSGGLDGARDWGRLYWGGAIFFLLADVRIRERTSGAMGLEHALRGVTATGANVESMWPIEQVLETGDKATGTHVLRELYAELGQARGSVDLDGVFRKLGVRVDRGAARFDDAAPLASVRDAILPR